MVTGTFPPRNFGGVTNVSYNLAKLLAQRGHDVTIYTTDTGNNEWSRLKTQSIEFREGMAIRYFRNISNLLAFKYRLYLSIKILSVIKKERSNFDIIHIHEHRTFLAVVVAYYARKYKIPYVVQAHGSVLPFFQKQTLKKFFDLFFGYKILKNASKIIALTKTEAEQYKKMGVDEDKIEIIPNGIDISEYNNLPKRGEFRKRYQINEKDKIVLYVGRLHENKGIGLLVEAFSEISKKLKYVKLVLVGPDDGYKQKLVELTKKLKIEDKILFTGFVTNEEKTSAFVDADVFVNPRTDEIFGIVFLEACACGTPVVCAKGCGLADLINNKCGYAVEYNKKDLQMAIYKILMKDLLRKKFGKEGIRIVKEKFNWIKIVEKLEKVYNLCKI